MASADLSVTKTASAADILVGSTLTYTVNVANAGPCDANSVVVEDTLPPSVAVESIQTSQGTGCAPIGNNVYLCSLGTLAAGATANVSITVTPTMPGYITNTVSVSSGTPDTDAGNNTASVSTLVRRAQADLSVTKTHAPELVDICTCVTYTIVVTNNGPAPATGVVLTDLLPSSLRIMSVCSSQGCCCHCGNEVTCLLGALAVNKSATIKISARPCQTGEITNTAIVSANEDDPQPDDNQASDTITVVTLYDQVEYLINRVNELAASNVLSSQQAETLLTDLRWAKHFIWETALPFSFGRLMSCHQKTAQAVPDGNICNIIHYLGGFIQTLSSFISQSMLPADTGAPLIKIAEEIIYKLTHTLSCLKGDECCEP